jgi:hypothetical protein
MVLTCVSLFYLNHCLVFKARNSIFKHILFFFSSQFILVDFLYSGSLFVIVASYRKDFEINDNFLSKLHSLYEVILYGRNTVKVKSHCNLVDIVPTQEE